MIQDIDDEHVLINKDKHEELKLLLKDVQISRDDEIANTIGLLSSQALKDTVKEAEESSESE